MKAFIHLHDNPKIEWPMAAYREPKPDWQRLVDEYYHKPDSYVAIIYESQLKEWQSSLLAYIKEPGFKVGEIVNLN